MQQALDYLEKHKVFIDTLNTEMVPLSEAYRAVELSVNQQLAETMAVLQNGLQDIGISLQSIETEQQNDIEEEND